MGLFGKLKFWKKEGDDFADLGLGKDDLGQDPFGSGKDPFADDKSFPPIGDQSSFDSMPRSQPQSQMQMPQQAPVSRAGFPQQPPGFAGYPQPASQQMQPNQSFDQPDFNRPFTMGVAQGFQQQTAQNGYNISKDMELISSKLDSLRTSLDIINQRLSNLERNSEREQMRRKSGW